MADGKPLEETRDRRTSQVQVFMRSSIDPCLCSIQQNSCTKCEQPLVRQPVVRLQFYVGDDDTNQTFSGIYAPSSPPFFFTSRVVTPLGMSGWSSIEIKREKLAVLLDTKWMR